MRSVFAAVAIGLMTAGPSAASSFVIVEDPSATPVETPEPATPAVPAISEKSSSIIFLGEPDPTPIASSPSARSIDNTATASVGNPAEDTSERGRILRAWAQAEADAAWAKVTAIQSASMIYFGTPAPDFKKVENDEARMSSLDPTHGIPMVMRGGIHGDLSPSRQKDEATTNDAVNAPAPATAPMSAAQEKARIAQRAKEREARPSPPRPKLVLTPREQSKIMPQ